MKKNSLQLVIVALAVSVLSLLGLKKKTTQVENVELSEPETHLNVGTINDWETKVVAMDLHNPFDESLQILAIQPSCGCTTISTYTENISTKGTARVSFSLHFGFKIREQKIASTILISSSKRVNKIQLAGLVKPSLDVSPRQVTNTVQAIRKSGNGNIGTIVINDIARVPIESVDAQLQSPALRCTVKRGSVDGSSQFQLDVSATPEILAEEHTLTSSMTVLVHRTVGDVEFQVPVEIIAHPNVFFEPAKINLGIIKNEEDIVDGTVRLTSPTMNNQFEVLRAAAPVSSIQLSVSKQAPGEFVLHYRIPVKDLPGDTVKIPVDFEVNVPDSHSVRLNIIGARASVSQCCNQTKTK